MPSGGGAKLHTEKHSEVLDKHLRVGLSRLLARLLGSFLRRLSAALTPKAVLSSKVTSHWQEKKVWQCLDVPHHTTRHLCTDPTWSEWEV